MVSYKRGAAYGLSAKLMVSISFQDSQPAMAQANIMNAKDNVFVPRLICLVVDDEVINRMVHRRFLTAHGIVSLEAKTGLEAVKICESGQIFDLILMDYDMPIMNGPEATKALRDMGVKSVIAAVTARSDKESRETFFEAGANYFFQKPLSKPMFAPLFCQLLTDA